jgi:hypothetical protein
MASMLFQQGLPQWTLPLSAAQHVSKTTVNLTLKPVRKGCSEFKTSMAPFAVRAPWKRDRSDHGGPRRAFRDHIDDPARGKSISARFARIDTSSPSIVFRARSASSAG